VRFKRGGASQTGAGEPLCRNLTALEDVVNQGLAVHCHGEGAANAHIIHNGSLGVETVVVGAQVGGNHKFRREGRVGLDTIELGRGHCSRIQVASFIFSKGRFRIQHHPGHFLNLGFGSGIDAHPERILDEGDFCIMDPFLHGIGTIGLVETGLGPAVAAGFGAVIAFNQPLGLGGCNPHAGDCRIVGSCIDEGHFEGEVINHFHAHGRGIIRHAVVVISSASQGKAQNIGVLGSGGGSQGAENAVVEVLRLDGAGVAFAIQDLDHFGTVVFHPVDIGADMEGVDLAVFADVPAFGNTGLHFVGNFILPGKTQVGFPDDLDGRSVSAQGGIQGGDVARTHVEAQDLHLGGFRLNGGGGGGDHNHLGGAFHDLRDVDRFSGGGRRAGCQNHAGYNQQSNQ